MREFFVGRFSVVLRRQIWATDYGEIRSRAGAVVNAGTRTWCIGNTRRKLSSGNARRGDGRPRLSNVKRGRRGSHRKVLVVNSCLTRLFDGASRILTRFDDGYPL